MDPVTHLATGVLLSQLIPTPSRFWAALAGAALALLPDADYFLVRSDRLAFLSHHRGFTHSLAGLPLLALLAAGINAAIGGREWFRPFFLLGLAVAASHLLLDWANSYGTQLLNPFSRQKFGLDWLFIIDPYITALLVAGATAVLTFPPGWGRPAGAVCLAGAAAYFLLCGGYHYQALSLARQVFAEEVKAGAELTALPQPFSPRRWQLLAARPGEIKQAMVKLPFLRLRPAGKVTRVREADGSHIYPGPFAAAYRPPESLLILEQRAPAAVLPPLSPAARRVLEIYLDFARFPLLFRVESQGGGFLVEWGDLRFTVPGRALPFLLQLRLDAQGGLRGASLGGGKIDNIP